MRSNRLQLHATKVDVLWCSSARRQQQIPCTQITVGAATVLPVRSVRDLGIYIDSDLSMLTHVTKTVSSCFAVMRQLRGIRRSVTLPVMQSLVVGAYASGLRLCDSYRTAKSIARSSSIGSERGCTTYLFGSEVRSHHSSAPRPSLVACTGTNCLLPGYIRLSLSTWSCTIVPLC